MLSSESFTSGMMWMLHAGSHSLWCSLLIVVALATSLNAPLKLLVDRVPVGNFGGSDGSNALAVAPVLLAAEGILLLRTPICRLFCAIFDVFFLHLSLFLSTWSCGSVNRM